MLKRILRVGLGVIFLVVFLAFLLVGALKFRLLSPTFWKTALVKGGVYQQLQDQVTKMRTDLETSFKKQTGRTTLPPQVAKALEPILSLDRVLTADRFKELIETNIDRLSGYLNGQDKRLVLYLPVSEWKLPVQAFGQPGLSKLTSQTPIEDALPLIGMKPDQAKTVVAQIEMIKTYLGYLVPIWLALLLLAVGIGAGHYFLGVGFVDRVNGTAWLVMISGFAAKLIGVGAGAIFEFSAANSNPPMPAWVKEMAGSLVGQFFNLGATLGLVFGIAGLAAIVYVSFFAKQGKVKEEKVKLSFFKKALAFILGVILGVVILIAIVVMVVTALGGKVNLKVEGTPQNSGSQLGTGLKK